MLSCTNGTPSPHHIPGYEGFVPQLSYTYAKTFAKGTHEVMKNLGLAGVRENKPCAKNCRKGDPCVDHWRELRAKLHMVQGEIDPNPCKGTEWNTRNKFCVEKTNLCEPKLKRINQHGYLSRLSVYKKSRKETGGVEDPFGVTACKADNIFPCKGAAQSTKPFWREYEDMTNYDPFKQYDPECRHLRLPKLRYKTETCWDDECCREMYVCKPKMCECLPLDARKDDKDVRYYRRETDPRLFVPTLFADPTNPYRYFKTGYLGHVPSYKFRIGEVYEPSTRRALDRFTLRYMTKHLKERMPVWIDPEQYCDNTDYFNLCCQPRKTYDGHFHEKPVRDRLKPVFDPKDCVDPELNEPLGFCKGVNEPVPRRHKFTPPC